MGCHVAAKDSAHHCHWRFPNNARQVWPVKCAAPVSGWRAGVSSNDIAYFLPSWCWKQLLYKSLRLLTSFYGFRSWRLSEKRFKEIRAHNYFTEARAISLRIVSKGNTAWALQGPHKDGSASRWEESRADRCPKPQDVLQPSSCCVSKLLFQLRPKNLGEGNAPVTLARHPSSALLNACQYCTSNSNFAAE